MSDAIRTTGTGDDLRLCCPVCGMDYIHPTAIHCNPAGSLNGALSVQSNGVHLDKTIPTDGSGVRIALELHCENGHTFLYQFRFHEGWTLLSTLTGEADGSEETIWRA